MSSTFRSLKSPNYRLWFIGALVSNVGAWMQATTQDWVVLTQLTDNDAVAVGTTMALQFGPQLLLVPITGLIADRFDRRKILFATQTSLMLLAAGLGALLLFGHAELWHVYIFAGLLGVVNAVDAPARQTFVSELVDAHNMSNAVALNSASFNAARLIGPAVAGGLIVAIGSGWVFLVNALSFVMVLVALSRLDMSALHRTARPPRQRGQLAAGFRYVRGRPDLLVVFTIVALIGAFGLNFPIFSSTMAVEFGQGAGEYGLLSSVLAIGSLTGALLAAKREHPRLRIIILAAGGFGLAAGVAALMPTFWSFAFVLIFVGFSSVNLMTTANGLVQTTTNPLVRGRVMALYMAVVVGGTPVGAPIVGWVADTFGPRFALGVGSFAAVVACLIGVGWIMVSRGARLQRHPSARWRLQVVYASEPDVAALAVDADREHSPEAPALTLTSPIPTIDPSR